MYCRPQKFAGCAARGGATKNCLAASPTVMRRGLRLSASAISDGAFIQRAVAGSNCRLISKLSSLCIDSLTLSWIRNFLSSRQQFTVVNDTSSNICNVMSGVPQGSVLGPLLFLIYINDLPANLSSTVRLFADDCVIYRKIQSIDDHFTLQNDLNLTYRWCEAWQMSLNASKCKLISFTWKRTNSSFLYTSDNNIVSVSLSYKYLGVHLSSDLSWNTHIAAVSSKASQSLGYLRRNLRNAPSHVRALSYLTYVRPQLEYASSTWSPHQDYLIRTLEAVQNRAARFIAGNYNYHSSITLIKQDLGFMSLDQRRVIALLCLFHRYIYSNKFHCLPLHLPLRTSRRIHNARSFMRIHGHTQAFNSSPLPRAIAHWNGLPDHIASISNRETFRDNLISLRFSIV